MFNYHCVICGDTISKERLEALMFTLELPPDMFKCVKCAELSTEKIKGIYSGFAGASDLILNNGIGHETGIYKTEDKTEIESDIAEVAEGEENINQLSLN